MSIRELWDNIADFEDHEIKNDSKNDILSNARKGARMEAYVTLFEKLLDKIESKKTLCMICQENESTEQLTNETGYYVCYGCKIAQREVSL